MDLVGKKFQVRGTRGYETIIDIVAFENNCFVIHMLSKTQWGTRESTEHLSRDLFDSCLRTGYLKESA